MTLRAQGARVAMPTPTPDVAANAAPPAAASNGAEGTSPCPRCREPNPVDSRFCHACGFGLSAAPSPTPPVAAARAPSTPASPPVAVVCARCRGVADPGADFCKFCGARLSSPQLPVDATPAPPPPRNDPPRDVPAAAPAPPPIPSAPRPLATPTAPAPIAPAAAATPSPSPPAAQMQQVAEAPPRTMGATRPHHGIGEAVVRGRIVRIAKDGSEGAHHPIVNETTDVGRAEGNIVLPEDPYLSPRHARIVARGTSLVLVDLGSVNGTFVRIRAPHTLAHGDLLLLGQQVLRFEAVSELEGARGPAMQHGVLLFGSPAPVARGRLVQRTVEGLARDMLYLVRDELVIGRETGDRTFPDDVFMSRRHAVVRRESAGYVVQDLGSSNGTFIQIHGEHTLQDGDQFRIGHHLFRFDVAGTSTSSPAGAGPS